MLKDKKVSNYFVMGSWFNYTKFGIYMKFLMQIGERSILKVRINATV